METEELIKLVDGIYKNILDKFNPGARQMINAGKAYLKALHGAAAASRMYVDAISKLAKQAQQGTWGGSSDIGAALMKIVEVYKEIQDQQMNILKAFYVDLLVPLETNLEKDTKVVQSEQKRFLQQHKQRSETYSKAAAMMKKQRKKSRTSSKTGLAMDKELKNMQVLEEEKTKLDSFCEQSLKNAMTQERRRYGFVLERHCSLAKHYLSYHTQGMSIYQQNIEKWSDVAKTREYLPETVENIFSNRIRQISVWQDEDLYSNPRSPHFDDDRLSLSSQLRKTKSMDASCLDIRSIGDVGSPVTTLSRAKSEYNLNSSTHSLVQDETPTRRPKSIAVPPPPQWDTQLARALYAYLSSGENQLSFLEGDLIALIGERTKGWQFGENLRTQCSGWFPLAYTEVLDDSSFGSPTHASSSNHQNPSTPTNSGTNTGTGGTSTVGNNASLENPTPRMFGDTLHLHRSSANAKQIRRAIGSNNIPPPALPAPVPTPSLPYHKSGIAQSHSANFSSSTQQQKQDPSFQSPYSQPAGIKSSTSNFNFNATSQTVAGQYSTHPQPSRSDRPTAVAPLPLHLQGKGGKIGGPVGNVSLHSSNDSGFSNDPPPQPEIDYSDDESISGQTKLPNRPNINKHHRVNSDAALNRTSNQPPNQKKMHSIRPSNSSGNLVERRFYNSQKDIDTISNFDKKAVKRTKSFWKFGKSSDNEILEGMALWKHKDLVDVPTTNDDKKKTASIKPRKIPRDRSNDSDKTLNAKYYNDELEIKNVNPKTRTMEKEYKKNDSNRSRNNNAYRDVKNGTLMPPIRKESVNNNMHDNFDDEFERSTIRNNDDQFYEDSGDGLVLRTVNRKEILQQYTNDSTGPDSESESEITSDDPYDCILVDDQTTKPHKGEEFSNVAAIGKKLEKLSKQYSPNKNDTNNNRSSIEKITRKNNDSKMNAINDDMTYGNKRHSFKTFGIESQNSENGESELNGDVQKYYHQQSRKRNNERNVNGNNHNNNHEIQRRNKQSYDSIDSELDNHENNMQRNRNSNDKMKEKLKYDDFDEGPETRQFLPRTKLTKTNSSNSTRQEQEDLMEYGESLKRRTKGEFNEKAGNMYGPWYDLWGLDASGK
ncbi:GATA zinc finger domain-containing protein 14 isoform X2 [Onthophagus taurus]|uniref:GATA zinc finger domain-containing protein 14 isoform X2 n=1 Tax=Onthophagus taurus TaxID=166361 RepID=UPI000C20E3C4|nr:GATA zinc finger domain-containing protein 14 isoform X2 [Onthophagus taurus]